MILLSAIGVIASRKK
ncbi:MAG: hypothetical protein ACLU8Q_03645 [Oscillospiraceae bacterium]